MALVLPRSLFIHVPKTGGQWVRSALDAAGVPVSTVGVVHASPDEIAGAPETRARPFRFAMVRHPLTWYQSMWAHQVDDEWEAIDATDWFTARWLDFWAGFTAHCASFDFREFVDNCLERYPSGLVSTLYDAYTAECAFVGHQETLSDDLVAALRRAGEDFDEARLRRTRRRNVRGGRAHRKRQTTYRRSLMERVLRVERRAVEKFGYGEIPSAVIASLEA